MKLKKQVVPVLFNAGVDTKVDKKTLQGSLLELENGYWQKQNTIQKRNGYKQYSSTITPTGAVASGRKLAIYGNELNLLGSSNLYSYSQGSDKWIDKGEVIPVSVSNEFIMNNSFEQTSPDSASANGITVYAWEDTRGGVRASVLDSSSKGSILSDTLLSANGARPKVIAAGNYIFVYYVNSSSTLVVRRIDALSPASFGAEVTISASVNNTTPIFDVCLMGSNMLVVFRNTSPTLSIVYFMQSNVVGSTIYGVPNATTIAQDADRCINIIPGYLNEVFWIVFASSANGLRSIGINRDFSAYKAAVALDAASTDIRNVTAYVSSTTLTCLYELQNATTINQRISKQTLTIATNTAGTAASFVRSVGLASKVFEANDRFYVLTAYGSTNQATYFVIRDDGFLVAKALPQIGGGLSQLYSQIPSVNALSETEFFVATLRKVRVNVENATVFTTRGVTETGLDFTNTGNSECTQLGENLHIAGGFLKAYDGYKQPVELGFHLRPELPSASQAGGGSIAAGTYNYLVVWEWIDNKGQIHRSAPSDPLTVVVGGANTTVTLTVPTLRLTAKSAANNRTEIIASVYRTESGGTLYYRVSSILSPTYNSTTADTVAINDTLADASIISNQLIYTTGGVVENIAPPPCNLVKRFANRLVVAGLEDGNTFWLSREFVAGEGVQFSDILQYRIDPSGGPIVAIMELDDKFVFFKENAIYIIYGQGPNDRAEGAYSVPEPIPSDVGCSEVRSVVRIPDGILFKSAKGIYILGRDLTVNYIGAGVEAYNDLEITSATVVADVNHARFTTAEGRTLVFDFYFSKVTQKPVWFTWTNQEAASAIAWNNTFVLAKESGEVIYEFPGWYLDVSRSIQTKITTGWMSFAGLQGFQRVFGVHLLGEYLGTHVLTSTISYDFREFAGESFSITPETSVYDGTWGSDASWGSGEVFGGSGDGVYQFKMKPARQKCMSVKLSIQDSFPDGDNSAGFSVSALAFEIGILPGSNRIAETRTMT